MLPGVSGAAVCVLQACLGISYHIQQSDSFASCSSFWLAREHSYATSEVFEVGLSRVL